MEEYGQISSSHDDYGFPRPENQYDENSEYDGYFEPFLHHQAYGSYPPSAHDVHTHSNAAYSYQSGPVVHEGFIPNPNRSDTVADDLGDDAYGLASTPQGYADPSITHPLFETRNNDDLESSDEASQEEEAVLEKLDDVDLYEEDPDYHLSEDDDLGAFDDGLVSGDEEVSGPARLGPRGRSSARGRGRGGRGGKHAKQGGEPRGSSKRGDPAGGDGQRGGFRGKRGSRRVADPGREFKRLQGGATEALMEKNFEEALDYATRAITHNPEIFAAHSLLSEVYRAMGKEKESLYALFVGAYTKRDPEMWWYLAERTLDFEELGEDRLWQAYQCYTQIIKLNPNDYEAKRKKLELDLEMGNEGKARTQCIRMLKVMPGDTDTLCLLADLCSKSGDTLKAVNQFEASFDYFLKGNSSLKPELGWNLLNMYLELVQGHKRSQYALSRLRQISRWLLGRAEETYWDEIDDDREWDYSDEPRRVQIPQFQPQKFPEESYGAGMPWEIKIKLGLLRLTFGPEHLSEALQHFELLQPDDPNSPHITRSPDALRDVGDALTKYGHYKEALRFYEPLRQTPLEATNPYFLQLAKCYLGLKRVADAIDCYEIVIQRSPTNAEARVQRARLYEEQGDIENATRLAKEIVDMGKGRLLSKTRLQGLIEKQSQGPRYLRPLRPLMAKPAALQSTSMLGSTSNLGPMQRAVVLPEMPTDEPMITDDEDGDEDEEDEEEERVRKRPRATGRRPTGPRPLSTRKRIKELNPEYWDRLRNAQERNQRVKDMFEELRALQSQVEEDDEEAIADWMEAAAFVIADFSNFKAFFPRRDKNIKFAGYSTRAYRDKIAPEEMEVLAKKHNDAENGEVVGNDASEQEIPTDYRDISFDEWLDVFLRYSFLAAKLWQKKECFETLKTASAANVFFHDKMREQKIYVCWLACSLMLQDDEQLVATCRWFIKKYPFAGDIARLYGASHRFFPFSPRFYNSGPAQKFILRQIKAMDFGLLTHEQRLSYNFTPQNWASYTAHAGLLQRHDPSMLMMYGHVLAAGGTYTAALNYYFRAYVLTPADPILCLSIATAYLQLALKRQSENRHYQIQQGISFLTRYHALRTGAGADPAFVQEAEFNVGRAWHLLGVTHLAVEQYRKVLALSERVREANRARAGREPDTEDFAAEAAFALQTILALGEDFAAAKAVTDQWLVIE